MSGGHRHHVEMMLTDAGREHERLLSLVPDEIRESLPVDAQGVTQAIDHLARAAGLTESERRALIKPHAVNPAVLHARVFGRAPLQRETVIGSFVEGARVRAEALAALADTVGGEPLGATIRALLVANPPPVEIEPAADDDDDAVVDALRATYQAQERAAMLIAAALDANDPVGNP